jgi:hypothetical protein
MKSTIALACLLMIGCASAGPSACAIDAVPSDAAMTRIHGVDFAHYPSPLPVSFSGCKHVWIGDRSHRDSMKKMSTAYFENGEVRWFTTAGSEGAELRCVYRSGALDESVSASAAECPLAADLERR